MKVIIVGCTHAGTFAAKTMLQNDPSLHVTIYEKSDNIAFLSCGVALYLDRMVKDTNKLFYATPQQLTKMGVNIKTKHFVQDIDPKKKTVTVENLKTHKTFVDHYDKLVMTTGSRQFVPPIQGIHNNKAYRCKGWEDARRLFKQMEGVNSITLVGCGLVGIELADAYSNQDIKVHLVDHQKRALGKYLNPTFSKIIEKDCKARDISLVLNDSVASFENHVVKTVNGKHFKSDAIVFGAGFIPDTHLLFDKVKMKDGAIIVNDYMQSSNPDIYAAGDSATVKYNPTGQPEYKPLASNAVRQGILVGQNIERNRVKDLGSQAATGVYIFGRAIAETGLTLKEAKQDRVKAHEVITKVNYRPDFMPTNAPVLMSLVYNPDSRRILGGALMCRHDISMAANTLSVMIQDHDTIDELAMVDMLFQPYFDSPFNYLNVLGQAAVKKENQANKK